MTNLTPWNAIYVATTLFYAKTKMLDIGMSISAL